MRARAGLGILAALCAAGCYSHIAWIDVSAGASGGPVATFSEAEQRKAVEIATSVATKLGLGRSWMERLNLTQPTEDYPYRHLAVFQGSGEYANLTLFVAVEVDATVLHFWIDDLDHGREMPLVREMKAALEEAVPRAFPGMQITIGSERRLRLFKG